MSLKHRAGVPTISYILAGLLATLPCCAQRPVNHPDAVKRLLVDYDAPVYYDEKFEPVPEDERARFELPDAEPYHVGVGDVVTVQVFSDRPVSGFASGVEARVKEDGNLHLPFVGRVQARDKTVLEIEQALTEIFQRDIVKDAHVSVEVTGYNARKFFVVGEVGSPGTLPMNGKVTLLEALIAAGGTNIDTADLDEAYVIRDQKPVPFSIRDIVMRGHPAGRLVMAEYDIVFVPHVKERTDYIYIFGEVGSPSRIQMEHEGRPGTIGSMTLAAAIAQAGGLRPTADINDVTVFRGGWQNPTRFRIGIHEVYQYGEEIQLRPGDRIAVGKSGAAEFNERLAPPLTVLGATTSALSLALSAVALASD